VPGESGHIEMLYPEEQRRKAAEAAMKIRQRNSSPSVLPEFSMEAKEGLRNPEKINRSK